MPEYKDLRIEVSQLCPRCEGSGTEATAGGPCPQCGGTKRVPVEVTPGAESTPPTPAEPHIITFYEQQNAARNPPPGPDVELVAPPTFTGAYQSRSGKQYGVEAGRIHVRPEDVADLIAKGFSHPPK